MSPAIGDHALGDEVGVDVQAADLLVEVEELLLGDLAGVQRVQAVLDADVVERPAREAAWRRGRRR